MPYSVVLVHVNSEKSVIAHWLAEQQWKSVIALWLVEKQTTTVKKCNSSLIGWKIDCQQCKSVIAHWLVSVL